MTTSKKNRRSNSSRITFDEKLILNQWILSLFEVDNFSELAEGLLDESLEGLDESNNHRFHNIIVTRFHDLPQLTADMLQGYDENIVKHTRKINEHRITTARKPIVWKYFQYLALLFSEIYLDFYFRDPTELLKSLNAQITHYNQDKHEADQLAHFQEGSDARQQLNKISFWMATGSGKTLLMQINILQFQEAISKFSRMHELNGIILITPNEGLSQQHLQEFFLSGMHAQIFQKNGSKLFAKSMIQIIEVTKLGDEMGDKTIAVDALEGNNLVLIDEGHRGASSGNEGAWMRFRNKLCEKGFSFEYSATFGQAVRGNSELSELYAKNILMDYSYRYFYDDGFGKEYKILNLEIETQNSQMDLYLISCLLSFFQQQLIYRSQRDSLDQFNIEKPLWIFVGSRVVKTLAKQDGTDIINILNFLARYVANSEASVERIDQILNHGLVSSTGQNLFAGHFTYLVVSGMSPQEIYDESLKTLFNAPAAAQLHVENIKNYPGEIALRLGPENDSFGVINVGDSSKLIKLCEENGFTIRDREFSESLFYEINHSNSKVNLLIGSKKFTEGWNSWRVSTMGLMNIGRNEGAQIIQLFGRGVRLKGYGASLKRSSKLELPQEVEIPKNLNSLETLGIFGIRANYMAQFRDFLNQENLPMDHVEIFLPVERLPNVSQLKIVRLKNDVNGVDTESSDPFCDLGPIPSISNSKTIDQNFMQYLHMNPVELNWYPKVQEMSSLRKSDLKVNWNQTHFTSFQLAFLDFDHIYFELEQYKSAKSWHNLNLSKCGLKSVLADNSWYSLQIPEEELLCDYYDKVFLWQEIVVALLKKYVERFYNFHKRQWEARHLELRTLDSGDKNFLSIGGSGKQDGYRILVDNSNQELISRIQQLKESIEKNNQIDWEYQGLKAIWYSNHLYFPLLCQDSNIVDVSPTPLNRGERIFVEDLKANCSQRSKFRDSNDLFLLRNLSKGRGVGFFEAGNFHPDFILWLISGERQRVVFVDPKGIRHLGINDPKLKFHETIKQIEKELGDPTVSLESYIVSNTPSEKICNLWGVEKSELQKRNILFQEEDRENYIDEILKT